MSFTFATGVISESFRPGNRAKPPTRAFEKLAAFVGRASVASGGLVTAQTQRPGDPRGAVADVSVARNRATLPSGYTCVNPASKKSRLRLSKWV